VIRRWRRWRLAALAVLAVLTKGDDGNKEDVQRHGQAAWHLQDAVSAPDGNLRATINAGREALARRILIFLCIVSSLCNFARLASGQRICTACTHGSVGFSLIHLSAPQPQHSAPNSFSPFCFAPITLEASQQQPPHCTALHCTALRPRTAVAICKSLRPAINASTAIAPFACFERPPITSPSAFVEFLAAVATPPALPTCLKILHHFRRASLPTRNSPA
jgi:hypothetical protein